MEFQWQFQCPVWHVRASNSRMWCNKHFSTEIVRDPHPDENPGLILSFSQESGAPAKQEDPEDQILRYLNDPVSQIDENWCESMDSLLKKLPSNTNHDDWLGISLKLVEIIQMMHGMGNDLAISDPVPLPDVPATGAALTVMGPAKTVNVSGVGRPENAIPFEIGLKLLKGADVEEELDMSTKKAVEELQRDVEVLSEELTTKDDTIKKLTKQLQHWRSMAKVRLLELRKEFEFRERMIFGTSPSQFNSAQ